jgi:tetratricopeptide (TPR) repeat protein
VEQAIAAAEREISERTHHQRETFPAAAWWREDVEVTSARHWPKAAVMEPPPREALEQILRKANDPIASLSAAIDRLIMGHRRYAEATGDVFYLVRTACNVGMRLIERGPASERGARGEIAVRLASLAFDYDPSNVFAWSLIRNGFHAAGRLEDAELIGWEALRRFPENPQWRSQLAPVLAEDLGRPEEAAALLRESVSLFPDDSFVRNQLATVLADDLGRHSDAKTVLETAQRDGAADETTSSLLRKLSQGRPLRAERRSGAPSISPPSHARIDLPTAVARRVLFQFEHGLSDIDAVRDLLSRHAPDAYLAYVGERTGARPARLKTTFALAFEDAARKGSAAALQALIRQTKPLETILVRHAIAAAEDRVEAEVSQDGEAGAAERIVDLTRHLAGNDAPLPPYRLLLLRDTAASFLSTDVLRVAA